MEPPLPLRLMRMASNHLVDASGRVFYCQLCLQNQPASKAVTFSCGHAFCEECARQFAQSMVNQGICYLRCPYDLTSVTNATPVAASPSVPATGEPAAASEPRAASPAAAAPSTVAPDGVTAAAVMPLTDGTCGCFVPEPILLHLLSHAPDALQRYRARKQRAEQPDSRECPYCHTGGQNGTLRQPRMTCTACARDFCFLHANAHEGRSCEAYERSMREEQRLTDAALSRDSKPCPKCGVLITKLSGCNAMTCSQCGTGFCWLCGVRIDKSELPRHFQWYNITGCANRQFASDSPSMASRVGMPIVTLLIFIVFGPPAVVLALASVLLCCCCCIPVMMKHEDGPVALFLTITEVYARLLMILVAAIILLPVAIVGGCLVGCCLPCFMPCIRRRMGPQAALQQVATAASAAPTALVVQPAEATAQTDVVDDDALRDAMVDSRADAVTVTVAPNVTSGPAGSAAPVVEV